jgi:4-carboxymuconolactone decarboxylase
MDEAERPLAALSAALATGDGAVLDRALRGALAADPVAVEEVLLQSYLFLGYPAALNGMARWRRLSQRVPLPGPEEPGEGSWRERGEAVCSRVYAGQYERLRAHVSALHPELERWMLVEGYGKVLGRPALSLRTRELCIVALLAGVDAAPQLYAHLRGALHVGATATEVETALRIAAEFHGPDRAAAAAQVWSQVQGAMVHEADAARATAGARARPDRRTD